MDFTNFVLSTLQKMTFLDVLPESRMSLVIGGEGPSEVVGAANRLVLVGWQSAN